MIACFTLLLLGQCHPIMHATVLQRHDVCAADNAYRVMVASDAVGMGLNLNIRRIIFHSVNKREGG